MPLQGGDELHVGESLSPLSELFTAGWVVDWRERPTLDFAAPLANALQQEDLQTLSDSQCSAQPVRYLQCCLV